jgi:L-iditol 2-dehydrogenase
LSGGETALVVGSGMIGLLTMQAARAAGCSRVFVADIDATRLELARSMGATEVIPFSGAELVRECQRLTNGIGADIVFEAVGRDETVNVAIDATRKGGTITLIGNVTPEVKLPLQKVVSRELRLQGTAASAGEYPQAIELISSGRIQVKPLITEVAQLADGQRWFDRLHAREPNLMKIVLVPSAEAAG